MDMGVGIAHHVTIKPATLPCGMKPTRIHGIASAWAVSPARLPSQQIRTINGNPCCCPDTIPASARKWHLLDSALCMA